MTYTGRIVEAFTLTWELHAAQKRKGSGVPYITHLMSVAAIVGEFGGDEDQFIAALLHDAVEDQGGLAVLDQVRETFGGRVADLVWGCSDAHEDPKPPWQERKENHIAEVADDGPDLKLIVAADKLHNARSIVTDLRHDGPCVWNRFSGGRDGTLWYYREMLKALRTDWDHPILIELAMTIDEMKEDGA